MTMALPRSQVRAHLGPGGYCRHSGNGGTQTFLPAACGLAQGVAQYGPSSSTQAQDPREGPSLMGRTTGNFLRCSLVKLAREETERSRRGTSRGSGDVSHDDQGQAGTSRRGTTVSSLVLRRQVPVRSPEESAKCFHFHATRPRPLGRQDRGHRRAHRSVTTRGFCRRRLLLSG